MNGFTKFGMNLSCSGPSRSTLRSRSSYSERRQDSHI
uniref:Uncharacterized protein n=1 Tax=Arundo donax TaxID=35708 RepID=A0A0A8YK48_ARUDO